MWSISACGRAPASISFYSSEWPHYKCLNEDLRSCSSSRLVILLLCSEVEQNRILQGAFEGDVSPSWVWLLQSYDQRIFPHDLYIPLNSMVIQILKNQNSSEVSSYLLQEIWRASRFLPQQTSELGSVLLQTVQGSGPIIPISLNEATSAFPSKYDDLDCSSFSGSNVDFPGLEGSKEGLQMICLNTLPMYSRRRNLKGVTFRITSINDTRSHRSYYNDKREEIFIGYYGEVWEALRKKMNFNYTIQTPKDGEFGSINDNDSWTGLVAELINGEADVIVAHLSRTATRSEVIDFTTTLLQFNYKIFGRKPKSNILLWEAYTRSFTLDLWGATIGTMLLFSVIFLILERWYSSFKKPRKSPLYEYESAPFLVPWAAFTMQGWPTSPDEFLYRFIFLELYIFATLLSAGYSATLVSFLTVMDDSLGFESLQELLRKSDYRLGIQKGSVLEEIFQTEPFLQAWNKLIIPYKDTLVDRYKTLQQSSFRSAKFTYVGSYEVQMIDIDPPCVIQAAKQTLFHNDGSIGFPKRSPYLGLFNHYIRILSEGGVLRKLKLKYFPEALKCSSNPFQAMSLNQTFSAFLFLGIGMMLSLILFSLEWKKCKFMEQKLKF